METLPLATVKARLSALVDQVEESQQRVVITRNGKPAAVLISIDELDGLEETLEITADPATMRRLNKARGEIERGEVLDEAQFRESMARSGRPLADR
jgi:antitoxin YefM